MITEAKKQLEILLINYFRECYPDFPKGNIIASESPDFVVKLKNRKKLGIELTRLHSSNIQVAARHSEVSSELIEISRELFERSSNWKLFVKILFSEKKFIGEERILSVSALLVNLIRKTTSSKNSGSFFHEILNYKQLPFGLQEILIVHHPGMRGSIWEEANNLGISNNILDDIEQVIRKKEQKLALYRKQQLDENWLLINSDRLQTTKSYNIPNQLLKQDFKSEFDRVVVFDLMKKYLFEWIK